MKNIKYRLVALFQAGCWPFSRELTGAVQGKTVVLDSLKIRSATLTNCTLIYMGGNIDIRDSHINRCRWEFSGKAAQTVKLLQILAASEGTREMVRNTFEGVMEKMDGAV